MNGSGCSYCSGYKICGMIDCDFCLNKSCYVYTSIWSKNNDILPQEVAISNNNNFLFECHTCHHSYEQSPNSKTNKTAGCPYCTKFNSKLCGSIDCDFCLVKSCHIYTSIWSKDNDKSPEQVTVSSAIKCLFDCYTCHHTHEQRPYCKKRSWMPILRLSKDLWIA